MSKSISIYTFLLAAFMTFVLFTSYTKGDKQQNKREGTTEPLPQIVKAIDLNKSFDFAGEPLPMENFDVKERLDRELLRNAYWHSSTALAIKRSAKYFPTIERILAEEGLPDDFKYLAVAESNLHNAVSPAGARGVWQFMKGTGQAYGLEVNSSIDERYHLEKATRAACKYLRSYKEQFGSWTLAAAAYNMGGPRLKKEIKTQRGKTFYDLNLYEETMRYVFRIVAIKDILSNQRDYGFYIDDYQRYTPLNDYSTVEVTSTIEDLGAFAQQHNISYRMLKVYNPWLVSTSLPNKSRRNYIVKIPTNKF